MNSKNKRAVLKIKRKDNEKEKVNGQTEEEIKKEKDKIKGAQRPAPIDEKKGKTDNTHEEEKKKVLTTQNVKKQVDTANNSERTKTDSFSPLT